ncbi:MAG: BREX system P-loop protein BrxC [Rhodoferax sp.]
MKNKDVFENSIDTFSLENQGVAKVDEAMDTQQQKTLRFELEIFVCKGHYEKGLQDILETYVDTLGRNSESAAAWVSGFFGSGKSHLVKMLRALWTNTPFVDQRTPRDIARLPTSVQDKFTELETLSRQKKTRLLAASGTLSQGDSESIRKAVLAIVFKGCGLPSNYAQASALFWLRNEGIEATVRQALTQQGRTLEQELATLTVSTRLHEAILRAKPGLARDSFELGDRLASQFSTKGDISQEDFLTAFKQATQQGGTAPIFLLVLDELQQYIADSPDRAMRVQEVVESLSKNMKGRVLVVATGQAALADTPTLSKLLGRFSVPVLLYTSDVDEVLRETVLKKKPSAAPALSTLFSPAGCLGEVSSHLRRSSFEHLREDEAVLSAAYPLLPTRQRLWERVLGSTDTTGTGVQLRSQLRLAFEAVKTTAKADLGSIVGGDFIYDEIRQRLRQSNQISAEIADGIDTLEKNGQPLKARVLKAVYLLSRVISSSAADTGLKTDAQSVADLLVDNLKADNSALRASVKTALDDLVDTHRKLMRVTSTAGGIEEYRLQTKESADWFAYLRNEETGLRNDPRTYESKVREELSTAASELVRRITIQQGISKQARRLGLHTDPLTSPKEADGLFVWLRSDLDGTQAKEVEQDAARAGLNASIAFVHVGLPKKVDLVTAIVKREAATRTLDFFGTPKTTEGIEARNALVMQQTSASRDVTDLLTDAIKNAQVFQGGGQAIEDGASLEERLRKAGMDGAARLFHRFVLADALGWSQAFQDASKGLVNALERVGHKTSPEQHPVAMEIITHIGSGSLKGSKLKERFTGTSYGWSPEAVLATLAVLFAAGQLKVSAANGQALAAGKFLERDANQYAFERENTPLSVSEKRAIARLSKCKPDDAEIEAPKHIATLKNAFARISGAAPRPADTLPALLDELDKLAGKDLVKRMAAQEVTLQHLADDMTAQAATVQEREPRWINLGTLMNYLGTDADASAMRAERQAILDGRQLLANPDPVPPLINRASNTLRGELNLAYTAYADHFSQGVQSLQSQSNWGRLTTQDQTAILQQTGLNAPEPAPAVGTLQQLITALSQCTPQRWTERMDAVAGKLQQAATACAKKLEPSVQPYAAPARMVRDEAELTIWLDEVRQAVLAKLKSGPVQF